MIEAQPINPAEAAAGPPARRRNLILLRAGDSSLHGCWLAGAPALRNWDLHISYYGSAAAPAAKDGPGITWSTDHNSSKWSGIAQALGRNLFNLDDYDYIALPDDDLIVAPGAWSRAFDIARKYGLGACQLSLLHDSFFGWFDTLHRPFLELRFVTAIELMAPVISMDVFKRMLPFLELEDNLWGMDHIVAHLLSDRPGSMAVLDAVTTLHTRAFWSGPLYDPLKASGRTLHEIEEDFLARHHLPRADRKALGAVTSWGQRVNGPLPNPYLPWARVLKRYRRLSGLLRIAHAENGQVYLARPFWGVPRLPVDRDKALLRRKPVG